MAAAPPNFNNYLTNTLGITDNATIAALNNQGLTDFDDLVALSDPDIKAICTNLKKPGGTIENPVWVATAVANRGTIPQFIPNPGVTLGFLHEKRLRMLRYYYWHLTRIQRPFIVADATLDRLANVSKLKDVEEEDEEKLNDPTPLTTLDNVRDVIENLDDYLLRKKGIYKVPLAYLTRVDIGLPTGADDPGFSRPTFYAEMIRRCPHVGSYYTIDNAALWDVVRAVCHGGPGWSWIQDWQGTRDGRSAYMALKRHYLGTSFTGRLRGKADSVLDKAYFDGTSRAFTFEKYCQALKGAFTDLESTGEHVHDERKVRILLRNCIDPRLEGPKNYILASETMKVSFEESINYLAQFLDNKKSFGNDGPTRKGNHRNVSGINVKKGNNNKGNKNNKGRGNKNQQQNPNKGSNLNVKNQYYKYEDWMKLSAEQQAKVRELRGDNNSNQNQNNKRRNVQAVNSNKRQRTIRFDDEENEDDTPIATNPPAPQQIVPVSIGQTMSQRVSRSFL